MVFGGVFVLALGENGTWDDVRDGSVKSEGICNDLGEWGFVASSHHIKSHKILRSINAEKAHQGQSHPYKMGLC